MKNYKLKFLHYLEYFCFILVILLLFTLNRIIPFNLDDLNYQWFITSNGEHLPLHGFFDILKCQYEQYNCWSGRVFSNGIAQLFCAYFHQKIGYDILATAMFAIWIISLCKLALPNISAKDILFPGIFLFFLFWLFCSDPTAFFLDVDFGMCYLYPATLCTLFLTFFLSNRTLSWYWIVSFYIISFFAGWSNEAFVVGTGAVAFVWLIIHYKETNKRQFYGFLFFCLGAGFLIFAPGNFSRMGETNSKNYLSVIARWTTNGELLFYIVLFFILFLKRFDIIKKLISTDLHFFVGWGVSVLFISILGKSVLAHMMLAIDLFGFLFAVRIIHHLGWDKILIKISPIGCICFIAFLFGQCYWQNIAAAPTRKIEQLCNDKNTTIVQVSYPHIKIPFIYAKHINKCEPIPEYTEQYRLWYHKPVFFYFQDMVDCLHNPKMKIPGDYNIYRSQDMFITWEKLENTKMLKLTLGAPKAGIRNNLKRLLTSNKPSCIYLESSFAKWEISPTQCIYQIIIPERNILYEIERIDINK